MKRDTNAINNGIGWLPAHNNNGCNAMLETDRAAIREDLITRIVQAAARPCPPIVERKMMQHKTTGKRHSILGMPREYNPNDYALVVAGFVFQDKASGSTYGTVYLTRELAEASYDARALANANEFRTQLEKMTASELNAQADFWIK